MYRKFLKYSSMYSLIQSSTIFDLPKTVRKVQPYLDPNIQGVSSFNGNTWHFKLNLKNNNHKNKNNNNIWINCSIKKCNIHLSFFKFTNEMNIKILFQNYSNI